MIARTLVPRDLSRAALEAAKDPPRRSSTVLDTRQFVPRELPVGPLETRSNIPPHVPLEVLAKNILVPRDLPVVSLPVPAPAAGFAAQTRLDERVVVPEDALPRPLVLASLAAAGELAARVQRDVMTTGEVQLLAGPGEPDAAGWTFRSDFRSRLTSIVLHVALMGFALSYPRLFPYQPPTEEDIELARRSLGLVYVPALEPEPLPQQAPAPTPQIRVDPRVFREIAPPDAPAVPPPRPGPETSSPEAAELPSAPVAKTPESRAFEPVPEQRKEAPRLESPQEKPSLALPGASPGRALEESLRGAARRGAGSDSVGFGGSLPQGPGGGGGAKAYGALQMLTPDEGVDFTHYLNRVLASVRRNWYAVIPESARLGEKGIVVLQFRILRDGAVPAGDPALVRTSGREPLDRAALSSIRASNPFEPLPTAFSGPFIELRFTFLYNLPLDAIQ